MRRPDDLPFIDEHSQPFDARSEAVWAALLSAFRRPTRVTRWFARLLGCDPSESTSSFTGRPGESVPGFRVADAEPNWQLVLQGRHRFAVYALTFIIDGDQLRAQTHAAFPGLLGRLYRAAVIGSGGHRIVTQRILRNVIRGASRQPPQRNA